MTRRIDSLFVGSSERNYQTGKISQSTGRSNPFQEIASKSDFSTMKLAVAFRDENILFRSVQYTYILYCIVLRNSGVYPALYNLAIN